MATTHTAPSRSAVRDAYVTGLKNAHALEQQALSIMDRQIERLIHYVDLDRQMRFHRGETERQIDRLNRLLGEFNAAPSMFKDMALSLGGSLAALGHAFAEDEILKNCFANVAFENYEAASYTSPIAMAEEGGFASHVAVLQETLREEQAMAKWLIDHVPAITRRYLELHGGPGTASR